MDLLKSMSISASGMDVQTTRLRVIAENLANQDTTGSTPGAEAYRRKTISFESKLNAKVGVETIRVKEIGKDNSALPTRYEPANPAADSSGYVKTPNVNSFVEVMDMREAQRSYQANLSVMQATRTMLNHTIEILR